jgi:hypothetical protein
VCYQVGKADIDGFQAFLDGSKPVEMPGLMKAHHVFSCKEKILYRALSCHCKGAEQQCHLCHAPQEVLRNEIVSPTNAAEEHKLQLDSWVAVAYRARWYLGQVKKLIDNQHVEISFMVEKRENVFQWPSKQDVDIIDPSTILCPTSMPYVCRENKRHKLFSLVATDYEHVTNLYIH